MGMVLVRCCVFSRHSGESRNPFCSWLLIFRADAKPDSRPCAVCPPSMAASHFLLLAQEKVTKEKGTLAVAVTRASCPRDYASRLRGSLTVRPCTGSERARFLRAPLRAFPAPARRGREGPGSKRGARQSLPQKQAMPTCGPAPIDKAKFRSTLDPPTADTSACRSARCSRLPGGRRTSRAIP